MRRVALPRWVGPAFLTVLAAGCGKGDKGVTPAGPADRPADTGISQPPVKAPPPVSPVPSKPAPAVAKGQLPPRDPAKEAAAAQQREARVKDLARAEAKLAEAIRGKHPLKNGPEAVVGKVPLARPMGYATSATLAPDGSWVAVGETNLRDLAFVGFRIHDLATDAEVCRIPLPGAKDMRLAISPDGSALAVSESKKRITLWDTKTGAMKSEFPVTDLVFTLLFTPDGSGLLVGTFGKVTAHDAATGKVRRSFGSAAEQVWKPAVSPDGAVVAAAVQSSRSGNGIALWESATGNPITELKLGAAGNSPDSLRFSPDGRTLYFRLSDKLLSWDLTGDKPKDVIAAKGVLDNVLSPDGRLAAFDKHPELIVAEVASGAEKKTKVPSVAVGFITFFPGGTLLGTFENGDFTVWDLARLRPEPK